MLSSSGSSSLTSIISWWTWNNSSIVQVAKEELLSRPRGAGPLPKPMAISHFGQYFAFGKGLQGIVGLPHQEKVDFWPASVVLLGLGCPYHPLLLAKPALDDTDAMCHV